MPNLYHPKTLRNDSEQTDSLDVVTDTYFASHLEPAISKLASIHVPPEFEVYWDSGDPENPRLWPLWYKGLTVAAMSLGATVVSLSSTLYTSGIPGLQEDFRVSEIVALLTSKD